MSQPPSPGDLHEDQVIALLRSGAHAALLSSSFGEFEYRELCHLAKLAATRHNPRGELVYILPGIMGSRLGTLRRGVSNLLWLHPAHVAHGGLLQLAMPGSRSVRALGVMLPGYLKLKLSLEIAGFRPILHPFDWRQDLDRLARQFMRAIGDATRVMIVGHSMGGVVARLALAHDTQRRIGRLIQLGAPNTGSFAPMQALRAVYPTVRKIAALDHEHTAEELARRLFLTLPGLYQMLPSAEGPGQSDFFDRSAWPDDGLCPDPALLEQARRRRTQMPGADERCAVIAGIDRDTVTSASLSHGNGFEYVWRRDGDGTVPLSRALWDGARTWFAQESHGALTNNDQVIAAVVELLKTGDCGHLSTRRPAPAAQIVRRATDQTLRRSAILKVRWDELSLDSRRRILEPVISPEFLGPG